MILPLRRRHRAAITALAVLLPATLVAALVARRPVPLLEALPAALSPAPRGAALGPWKHPWEGLPLAARLLRQEGRWLLEVKAAADPARPDLLLYWSAATDSGRDGATTPPPDAHLLGAALADAPTPFALPPAAAPGEGSLLLYSLAHGELVSRGPLPDLSQETPGAVPEPEGGR